MPEIQRKMIHALTIHRPQRDFIRGDRLARKVGVSLTTIQYHHRKLRLRIESRKGPYGGYRLIK